jgi:hypothetical protein
MNNEQIKEQLLHIRPSDQPFSVVLSGKASKKVNGLYKSDSREIVLHNKNFQNDNELMHTAIHEYAHHLQFTDSPLPVSSRAHTVHFWSLFHGLLSDAEKLGMYRSPFETVEELAELTRRIKEKFLGVNGQLMKEMGRLLLEAQQVCEKHRVDFKDYLDRVLNLPRASARTAMRSHALDLDPRIGFDNMRTLVAVADPVKRKEAEDALLSGLSPDSVKEGLRGEPPARDADQRLKEERERLERQIARLRRRIEEIDRRLKGSSKGGPGGTKRGVKGPGVVEELRPPRHEAGRLPGAELATKRHPSAASVQSVAPEGGRA